MFEVYTFFGRRVKLFVIPDGETHHVTLEAARTFAYMLEQKGNTIKKYWVRLVK